MERQPVAGGVPGSDLEVVDRHRPHRVGGGPDPHHRAVTVEAAQRLYPLRPACCVAVAETAGDALQRCVESTPQVARVEQDEADPRPVGGMDDGVPHGVGVAVGGAVDVVVDVVELGHGGDPGEHHPGEDRGGQLRQGVWVEAARHRQHLLTPSPEVPAIVVGAMAQRPVEDVGVGVDQPGQGDPVEADRPVGWLDAGGHVDDDPVSLHDGDVGHQPVAAQPGPGGVECGHGSIGMRTPRSRATSTALG